MKLAEQHCILTFYRRILDCIHQGGNIFNDKGRMQAYIMIARLASDTRTVNARFR